MVTPTRRRDHPDPRLREQDKPQYKIVGATCSCGYALTCLVRVGEMDTVVCPRCGDRVTFYG